MIASEPPSCPEVIHTRNEPVCVGGAGVGEAGGGSQGPEPFPSEEDLLKHPGPKGAPPTALSPAKGAPLEGAGIHDA